MTPERAAYLEALRKFETAALALTRAWSVLEYAGDDILNAGESTTNYPFSESFDEVDHNITEWRETIERMFANDTSRPSITVCQLADFRLGFEAKTGDDFEAAGLAMLGGCQVCGATIACYNAYPTKTGYWRCEDCLGDLGYATVEEANQAIFGNEKDGAA